MATRHLPSRGRCAALALALLAFGAVASACGTLPFKERPAAGYAYGSGAALRIAVVDETGRNDWSPAIGRAVATFGGAEPHLSFGTATADAHIVMTFRRYSDSQPPALPGYLFPAGAGGFAAVYDVNGTACNFPPSPLPAGCTGEIARVVIYLNDVIPAGSDIEARRLRLILHEMGHGMGLTRHSPDLGLRDLALRYGW